MKVLVPVKRVVDYNVKVRVKSDGSGVGAFMYRGNQQQKLNLQWYRSPHTHTPWAGTGTLPLQPPPTP